MFKTSITLKSQISKSEAYEKSSNNNGLRQRLTCHAGSSKSTN
jgi:hypothetical protein